MKVTQMPPVHAANLVTNSGNTAYGIDVRNSTQVLSKFYFRDTPEQDQRTLRTIGSELPN